MNERFKEVRSSMHMTRRQMAELLGVSPRTYEKYEYGTTPPAAFISLFCEKTGVSEEWIRHGTGNMISELPREKEIAMIAAELFKSNGPIPEDVIELISIYADLSPSMQKALHDFIMALGKEGRTNE